MKIHAPSFVLALTLAGSIAGSAHDIGAPHGDGAAPHHAHRAPLFTEHARAEVAARYLAQQNKRPSVTTDIGSPAWFQEQSSRPGDSRKARSAWAGPQAQAPQRRTLLA